MSNERNPANACTARRSRSALKFLASAATLRTVTLATTLAVAAHGAAFAQEKASAVTTGSNTDQPPGEIVVTALKASQKLINVAATVSVVSAQRIAEDRIDEVSGIAATVPNVDIRDTVPGVSPVITIRGIGLDDFSTTDSPAVGVLIDEVPLSSIALLNSEFFDIGRVEVVKGPQGTLYGRNTVGGAVNIISAKPTDSFDAAFSAGYGNYDTYDVSGMINVPLSNGFALRLGAKTIQQEKGFYTSDVLANGAPGERDIGRQNIDLARVQLGYNPNSNVDIDAKYERQQERSQMGQYKFYGAFVPGEPFVPCAPILAKQLNNAVCTDAYGFTNTDPNRFHISVAHDVPYDVDEDLASLRAKFELGRVELTSITGYIDFNRTYSIDVDATPLDELNFVQRDKVEQFSQELRASEKFKFADVLVGAFYSYDRDRGDNDDFIKDIPLVLFGFPSQNAKTDFQQETNSAAVFGNVVWHLTDALNFTTGLRYTSEDRHYVGGTTYPLCPIAPANPSCAAVGVSSTLEDAKISDNNVSWKVGLDYKLGSNMLLYSSISKGTKSGGFVTRFTTSEGQLLPYRPESLIAYEVGAKAQLNRMVSVDGAVFHYDFSDFQTTILDGSQAVPLQRLGNVSGTSKLTGAEINANVTLIHGLTLQTGLGWLDSKIAPFSAGAAPFTNNRFPNAPEWTFNSLLRYETPIYNDAYRLILQTDASYESSAFKDAGNDPFLKQRPYWLVNARAAIDTSDKHWELAFWVKNLSNTQYNVSGGDLAGLGVIGLTTNDPRTFGASISWRY